jgi:hypothetical protein
MGVSGVKVLGLLAQSYSDVEECKPVMACVREDICPDEMRGAS